MMGALTTATGLRSRGILRLAYVRIAPGERDLSVLRQFYRDTLGLIEHEHSTPQRLLLRCWHEADPCSLVVEAGDARGLIEIGFALADVEELHSLQKRVTAAGAAVSAMVSADSLPGVGMSFRCQAPGDITLRLFAPSGEPPAYVCGHASPDWVTPRELRATPAPLFLNHVGVTVPDPAATVDFLTKVLGFVVSERIDSDDGRHLLSALLFRMSKDVGGQELALFRGEAGRLHHIAFAKEDPSDILIDGQFLAAARVKIDPLGPTRQSYGKTFSLYFYDPCGIRLELCSGGRITEAHPEFEPVVWTESHLGKALSFHDEQVSPEFLHACL